MAIEVNSGDVRSQTELLIRHLSPGRAFTSDSFPSSGDIDRAITTSEAEVLSWLAAAGHDIVIANWSVNAKNHIAWFNALGAAYRIEFAHTGLGVFPGPSTRGDQYHSAYMELYKMLKDGITLVDIGIPISSTKTLRAKWSAGSEQEKIDDREDSDRVQPIFRHGIMTNPVLTPEQIRKT